MSERSSVLRARWFAAGRLLWGAALIAAPQRAFRAASGSPSTRGTTAIVRLLGLREVAHASISIAATVPRVLAAGSTVDGIHALSMVVVATTSDRYRRPALLSAALATAATATGLMLRRSSFE